MVSLEKVTQSEKKCLPLTRQFIIMEGIFGLVSDLLKLVCLFRQLLFHS